MEDAAHNIVFRESDLVFCENILNYNGEPRFADEVNMNDCDELVSLHFIAAVMTMKTFLYPQYLIQSVENQWRAIIVADKNQLNMES
jgi:hypothetical protein